VHFQPQQGDKKACCRIVRQEPIGFFPAGQYKGFRFTGMKIPCRLPYFSLLSFMRLKFYDLEEGGSWFGNGDSGLDFDGDTMGQEQTSSRSE
jgi:hypothetical protein